MISDEKLASLAVGPTPEQEKVVRNVVRPVISEGAAVSHALQFLQDVSDMAQELLAYREAERKAKSWDDAPEWANWFARDAGWFYQRKPQPGDSGEWENLAGVAEPAMHDGWETSLQERPK